MKHTRGFTLVELLVSIALIGVLVTSVIGAFVAFLQFQITSREHRTALETVRFALSDLQREIYFGYDYEVVSGSISCLSFKDQLRRRVKVRLNLERDADQNIVKGTIEKSVQTLSPHPYSCTDEHGDWIPLTANFVVVKDLLFELDSTFQPQIKITTKASYFAEEEEEDVTLHTQVTRRILKPSADLASDFIVGNKTASDLVRSELVYFQYAPLKQDNCPENRPYKNQDGSCANFQDAEKFCLDSTGEKYDTDVFNPCGAPLRLLMTTFSSEGLYVLAYNGLIFFIDNSKLEEALGSTGGRSNPESVDSIVENFVRTDNDAFNIVTVRGNQGGNPCSPCDDQPSRIASIYSDPNYRFVYALSENGALYKIRRYGTNDVRGERLLYPDETETKSKVRFVSADARNIMFFFVDEEADQQIRYHDNAEPQKTHFQKNNCSNRKHINQDLVSSCTTLYEPPELDIAEKTEVKNITTFNSEAKIKGIQTLGERIFIWFSDEGPSKLLARNENTAAKEFELARDDTTTPYSKNKEFLKVNDTLLFTCKNEKKICSIGLTGSNGILGGSPTVISYPDDLLEDRIIDMGTLSDTDVLAITERGILAKIVKANGRNVHTFNTDKDIAPETLFDSERVLCETNVHTPENEDRVEQQVNFYHITSKPSTVDNKKILALLGVSYNIPKQQYIDEVYIALEADTDDRVETGPAGCGNNSIVERLRIFYDADDPNNQIDVLRLTDLEFLIPPDDE